jgi:DNA-binding transcriptional regulator YdaS (Cro superfamily)
MNPLREHLISLNHPTGLTGARAALARKLRCHPGSIRNIDSGLRRPSWSLALRIEHATNGAVSAEKIMRAKLRSA